MTTVPVDPAECLNTSEAMAEYLADLFGRLDADGPGDGRTLGEIEAEIYGAFGEPI